MIDPALALHSYTRYDIIIQSLMFGKATRLAVLILDTWPLPLGRSDDDGGCGSLQFEGQTDSEIAKVAPKLSLKETVEKAT